MMQHMNGNAVLMMIGGDATTYIHATLDDDDDGGDVAIYIVPSQLIILSKILGYNQRLQKIKSTQDILDKNYKICLK